MKYSEIVSEYVENYRPDKLAEIEWVTSPTELEDAIKRAAQARNKEGKKFSHQRRLKNENIERACKELIKAKEEISACKSFESLFDKVGEKVLNINGIGPLYHYDTAFRIGAKINLYPTRVYLNAGARTGAINLGLAPNRSVEPTELPREFQNLKPYEIENLLCIFKDNFDNDNKIKTKCYIKK